MHDLNIDNNTFINALFKEDAPFCHVTDFGYDPSNIPKDKHLIAWKGDWYSRYKVKAGTNQYFTISIFNPDDKGVARRRKALFLRTRVIVLDDVREKLDIEAAKKLPQPAWILETSQGSEQWGYILTEPCHDRGRVENLLDGLVANGLAPDGKDPGMKGVTRYVRLPEGYNTKSSKLVGGLPSKCRMLSWNPERTTTLEALAQPFNVDLNAERREARIDGAANVPDHPILKIPELVKVKEIRSDGRFDITCPWVHEHTGEDDSGTAVFTNDDGSLGFKCHHGNCQSKTAGDLLKYIETKKPGFGANYKAWQFTHFMKDVVAEPSFMAPAVASPPVADTMDVSFTAPVVEQIAATSDAPVESIDSLFDALRRERPNSQESRNMAQNILKFVDTMPAIDRNNYHKELCDIMRWTKTEFKPILDDLRRMWYNSETEDGILAIFKDMVYIQDIDSIYDYKTKIFHSVTSFQNSFAHIDTDAKKKALQEGMIKKVSFMEFNPEEDRFYKNERGVEFCNLWDSTVIPKGRPGDVTPWLNHFDALGWGVYRDHVLKWMAYTLRHPGTKINHMLLLGGAEGIGKDFILDPLKKAMTDVHFNSVDGVELLTDYQDYLLGTKFLVINEVELGDHRDARVVSNKLKPLAAGPPDHLRVNQKFVSAVKIRNIVNTAATTNSRVPVQLHGTTRRIFPMWSDLNMRDNITLELLPEWKTYWREMWEWYTNGGMEYCIDYLYTQVDLSDFNPGEAPPVTEFLREIQDASKSPWQITVEGFMNERIGAFGADIITAADAADTIRGAGIQHSHLMQVDPSRCSSSTMGKVIGAMQGSVLKTGRMENRSTIKLWIIRNHNHYASLSQSELYAIYKHQMSQVEKGMPTTFGVPNLKIAK